MRKAGMVSEALGRDPIGAAARAELLNAQWDEIRAGIKSGATRNAPQPGIRLYLRSTKRITTKESAV